MKEFVFGFQIAAAIKNNFNNAFSSASSQIMLLNEKIRNNSQIVTMSAEATKKGILNMKSYNNVLAQTYKYYAKATEHAQKYLKIQGKLNQRRSSMNQNQANIMSLGGIALTLTEPMKKAIQFETAMSDVKKVVDFESPQQFQQMNQDILELSKKFQWLLMGWQVSLQQVDNLELQEKIFYLSLNQLQKWEQPLISQLTKLAR